MRGGEKRRNDSSRKEMRRKEMRREENKREEKRREGKRIKEEVLVCLRIPEAFVSPSFSVSV